MARGHTRRANGLWRKLPVYLGFAASGIALTIPGAVLPVLLQRWQMNDARGGALLFCLFVASCVGSLVVRGALNRSVTRGTILLAAGALWLGHTGELGSFMAIAVYGLGIGLTMTSTSLLVSRRFPAERRIEMTRLNLAWATGASLGPWLALRSNAVHLPVVLNCLAVGFVAFGLWVGFCEPETFDTTAEAPALQPVPNRPSTQSSRWWGLLATPWPLLVLIFCTTGMESATGGWLTAYAQRAGESLGTTISAATFLWMGALVSRLLHSTPQVARIPERAVLTVSTCAITAAIILLIAIPVGPATMVAAAMLGLATGPMYPLVVAAALRHREDAGIFITGAFGAALLPMLTGVTSTWAHSLRGGLGVPLAAGVAMMAMMQILRRKEA